LLDLHGNKIKVVAEIKTQAFAKIRKKVEKNKRK